MADTPGHGSNPVPGLIFVDCEATGLHQGSYPISVGLAWCDGRSQGVLIRPHAQWTHLPWDPRSIRIHGITPARLQTQGHAAAEVAEWLNRACAGCTVVSDAPAFEAYWLGMLFRAAGQEAGFALANAVAVGHSVIRKALPHAGDSRIADIWQSACERARALYPHTHVAEEDALGAAMMVRFAAEAASDIAQAASMEKPR